MAKQTQKQREQFAAYAVALQEQAAVERQDVIDAVNALAVQARRANAERQAVEEARLAELRAKNAAAQAQADLQEIRARWPTLPQADFERMLPQLREKFLLEKADARHAQMRAEIAEYLG